MAIVKGEGYITSVHVTREGDVALNVMGRDHKDGRYAAFFVYVPWTRWEAINETAYNEREDQAQGRIC